MATENFLIRTWLRSSSAAAPNGRADTKIEAKTTRVRRINPFLFIFSPPPGARSAPGSSGRSQDLSLRLLGSLPLLEENQEDESAEDSQETGYEKDMGPVCDFILGKEIVYQSRNPAAEVV